MLALADLPFATRDDRRFAHALLAGASLALIGTALTVTGLVLLTVVYPLATPGGVAVGGIGCLVLVIRRHARFRACAGRGCGAAPISRVTWCQRPGR